MRTVRHIPKALAIIALTLCGTGISNGQDVDRGIWEVQGFAGVAVDPSIIFGATGKFAGGLGIAYGLNRHFALTGDYALNDIGVSSFCIFGSCASTSDEKVHEFMGGLRFSLPNRSRVTPYATGTIGAVTLVNFGSVAGNASTEFAYAIGAGLDVRITRRTGVALELHGTEAVSSSTWLIRPTAGFYLRF